MVPGMPVSINLANVSLATLNVLIILTLSLNEKMVKWWNKIFGGKKPENSETHPGHGLWAETSAKARAKPCARANSTPIQGMQFPSSRAAILSVLPTSEGWFLHHFLYTYFSSVGFNQHPKPNDLVHKVLLLCKPCGAAAPVNWINESCTSYFLVMLQYHNCRFARLVSRQLKK